VSILNQFPVRRPLRRQPVTGRPLLVGYTRSQRIALGALKFAGKVGLAFAIGWLLIVLALSYL
jgi:hypothetical protein